MGYLTGEFIKWLAFRTKGKLFSIRKIILKNSFCINNLFTTANLEGKKCLKCKVKVQNTVIWRQINNRCKKVL